MPRSTKPPKTLQPADRRAAKTTTSRERARPVARGDVPPSFQPEALARHVASEAASVRQTEFTEVARSIIDGQESDTDRAAALRVLLDGASEDDRRALRKALFGKASAN